MNRQRVENSLFTLLNHPDQAHTGTLCDLHLALWSENPVEQGQVAEMLLHAVRDLVEQIKN